MLTVQAIADAMAGEDIEGTIVAWSPAAERLYGWAATDVIGRHRSVLVPEGEQASEQHLFERAVGGEQVTVERVPRRHRSGRGLDVRLTLTPLTAADGQVITVIARSSPAAADPIDTVPAESDVRFAQLANGLEVGVSLRQIDPSRYLYVNPAYVAITGYDPVDDPDGDRTIASLLHPDDRQRVFDAYRARTDSGQSTTMEMRLLRPDGEVRWVRATTRPIWEDGAPTGLVAGSVDDITDRKAVEAALLDSEQLFQDTANNVKVGITLSDVRDTPEFVYVNAAYRRVLGVPDDATPMPTMNSLVGRLIHPDDRYLAETVLERVRLGEEVDEEFRIIRPDGAVRWLRSRRSPIRGIDGTLVRIAGTTEDVTDRKNAEAALLSARQEAEQANSAKSEYLSRMSHELRTPLNAILGFAQLLEMSALSDSQRDSVGYIMRAGRHLLAMVNDILDISSMEAGHLEMSLEPVDVGQVIHDGLAGIRSQAEDAQVAVAGTGLVVGSCFVTADARRLRQVLHNLLSNAVKFNQPGGWAEVGCRLREDHQVEISVSDGGPGISAEDMGRLFTPFDRLGQQASGIEGNGIGLALSHRLVIGMAGTLTASSAVGAGSTFTVTLPLTDAHYDQVAGGLRPLGDPSTGATRLTLLYIEDNVSNVRLMEKILARRPGWELVHADRGELGITLARTSSPSLILLDVHLPDMNGMDVLTQLQQSADTADIPVVAASADGSRSQETQLLAAGADEFMPKPLKVSGVLGLLDRHAAKAGGLGSRRSVEQRTGADLQ